MAPVSEPTVAMAANPNVNGRLPTISAIIRPSGGMGKKLDSQNASTRSASAPQGVSAQSSTQWPRSEISCMGVRDGGGRAWCGPQDVVVKCVATANGSPLRWPVTRT